MKKKILLCLLALLLLATGLFFFYFNNTDLVNPRTVTFYRHLKVALRQRGYNAQFVVISTRRFGFHNSLLVKFSGAAPQSQHLSGNALDFIVLDVNDDGKADSRDVDIVFEILDQHIIRSQGGIGTYKGETAFIDRQMVHIDCRGYRARWAR